ncbi:MAG TPA: DJ-1/PfpI family protein [Polyangiales bacterium]|jgi:transcriptional regulator GlxA family with amidase domain|nr:DJ-1/PfpI family protein [Polyangiales bacterium]
MRRVLILIYDGVQTLDATGPAEVFASATSGGKAYYRVEFCSLGGGERSSSSGLRMQTEDISSMRLSAEDTLVVAGAGEPDIRHAIEDEALMRWLKRAARSVGRIASVCSGAFLLAAAGLLDGKRAATHWLACQQLQSMFPNVQVDSNAIFVRDGNTWTSAGVTTGIDMALAMVEHDIDRAAADTIAAMLVLYVRRPGYQSQFSQALIAQTEGSDPLGSALAWARANLAKADIDALARRAGLSVRTLHRRCLQHLGTTPAKLMDRLRVEHARTLLTTSSLPTKSLAEQCGFGNATRMHRAFVRELGMGPRDYRVLHAKA